MHSSKKWPKSIKIFPIAIYCLSFSDASVRVITRAYEGHYPLPFINGPGHSVNKNSVFWHQIFCSFRHAACTTSKWYLCVVTVVHFLTTLAHCKGHGCPYLGLWIWPGTALGSGKKEGEGGQLSTVLFVCTKPWLWLPLHRAHTYWDDQCPKARVHLCLTGHRAHRLECS